MSIKLANSIYIVDSHTGGHPTRIVVGGLPKIPGGAVAKQRDYIKDNLDEIRQLLCHEPRGHGGMYGAMLTRPGNEEADFGVIFYSVLGYDDMCGHGTIGVSTVLIETGMVPAQEPTTEITLEAPAGIIRVKAQVAGGKVQSVTLVNVPSFLYQQDLVMDVPGYGKVKGDVAFGGNWYYYVDAKEVGSRVRSENVDSLIQAGSAIRNEFNQAFDLVHPTDPNISRKLLGVSFIDSPVKNKNADQNNVMVEGKLVDRSPCGTGTCGRMAVLFAKNRLGLNEDFVNESISGSAFRGRLIKETKIGKYPAVVPQVSGSAYITGFNHIVLDPDDPLGARGFLLGQKL